VQTPALVLSDSLCLKSAWIPHDLSNLPPSLPPPPCP
jgi:hypothetical protein